MSAKNSIVPCSKIDRKEQLTPPPAESATMACNASPLKYTLTHPVTKSVLNLISHLFAFGPRFSKYFNEEWSLFYIRTHYLNFIRLYNKGMRSPDPQESKMATSLCKLHLQCLLTIATSRNEETSRNFFKLRCVEFLVREVDLEYDMSFSKSLWQGEKPQPVVPSVEHVTPYFTPTSGSAVKSMQLPAAAELEEEDGFARKEHRAEELHDVDSDGEEDKGKQRPESTVPPLALPHTRPDAGGRAKEELKEKLKLNLSKLTESREAPHPQKDPPQESDVQLIEAKLPAAPHQPRKDEKPKAVRPKSGLGMKLDLSKLGRQPGEQSQEASSSIVVKNISRVSGGPARFNKNVLASIKDHKNQQQQSMVVNANSPHLYAAAEGKLSESLAPPTEEAKQSRLRPQSRGANPKPRLALDLHAKKKLSSSIQQYPPTSKKEPLASAEEQRSEIVRPTSDMHYPEETKELSRKPRAAGIFQHNYKEDADTAIKVERPKGEGRFKLKRTGKDELNKTTVTPQPGDAPGLGTMKKSHKGRLLEVNRSVAVGDDSSVGNSAVKGGHSIHVPPLDLKRGKLEARKEEKHIVNLMKNEEPGKKKKFVPQLKLDLIKKKDAEKTYKERQDEEATKVLHEAEGGEGKSKPLSNIERSLAQNKNKWQLLNGSPAKPEERFRQQQDSSASLKEQHENEKEQSVLMREREARNIYRDKELHALMVGLLFCLLLKPPRGVLDELYCSANPSDNGKQNVLYLLHFHLNHPMNQEILPLLLKIVARIRPPLSGQRLLKLLCKAFFDASMYSSWSKIATGAFGTVFECATNLADPSVVAIKQMTFPNSIYDRCVLHDIFSEIASLQEFRGESCATTLHDYGVDDNNYYIVMKKYTCSLREWRSKQTGTLAENMQLYLHVFREVLSAVEVTHSHNVTHYDIKCDNFMLETNCGTDKGEEDGVLNVALGDFGECKLFTNEEDEYDLKPRGTECIKSPEMLTLTINVRKDTDKYDRRRRVGTTRASDIWSLGCLFFELLTGEYLFCSEDYVVFYLRVTSQDEDVLTEDKRAMLGNNVYLIDYLNFLLVRDPARRPDVAKAVGRFKHVHALLVNAGVSPVASITPPSTSGLRAYASLDSLLETCASIMYPRKPAAAALEPIRERQHVALAAPGLMKVMRNVFLCSRDYLYLHTRDLIKDSHVTHVIMPQSTHRDELDQYFDVMTIRTCKCGFGNEDEQCSSTFSFIPSVMDYCRKTAISRGVLLFVDDEGKNCTRCGSGQERTIRECLLVVTSFFLQTSGYETWTLVNSQILFMSLPQPELAQVTRWVGLNMKISAYVDTYPRYSCLCGCCTFVLARQFADQKNLTVKTCGCSATYNSTEASECPSRGCAEFLDFVRTRYGVKWEQIKWGYFEKEDFLVGPFGQGMQKSSACQRVILGSDGADQNSCCCGATEKGATNWSVADQAQRWYLFKCRVCNVWTHALSMTDGKIALILNNPLSKFAGENRFVAKRESVLEDKDRTVKVPILANIGMTLPF